MELCLSFVYGSSDIKIYWSVVKRLLKLPKDKKFPTTLVEVREIEGKIIDFFHRFPHKLSHQYVRSKDKHLSFKAPVHAN